MHQYTPTFVDQYFGHVKLISDEKLVAGSFNSIKVQIKVGRYGIDDGGHLKLAWPITNSFGIPQFTDPQEDNYCSIISSGECNLSYDFDHNNYVRPFMPCITLKIFDGVLKEGDTILISLGDQTQGSRGFKTQTYVENGVEFKVMMDPFGTNDYLEYQNSPKITVISGSVENLKIINQSEFEVGKPGWLLVRGDDLWGNLAKSYESKIILSSSENDMTREIQIEKQDQGKLRLNDIIFEKIGVYSITAEDPKNGLTAIGNPFVVRESDSNLNLFWGDLHGQTGETVGSGTIEEYLDFGKDVAGLDFISHAANAFQVTNKIWENTQRAIKSFHQPKRFITFLGYEWSGVTSAGGDHNVYYLDDDMPIHRCSHAQVPDKSDLDTDRYPISELYEEFKGRADVMIIPHIGGRKATLDVFDEELTPFIEIVSVHGHFDWFARDALSRKLKTGFIASSDTHSGRPGDTFPVSYIEAVRAGLTAVYAQDLTRIDLWKAFKKRNVYATTGARIIINFTCNQALMGEVLTAENSLNFQAKIIGTAGIEKVELCKGLETIYSPELISSKTRKPNQIIIRWKGARTIYRRRNLDWSGTVSIKNGQFLDVKEFAFDLPWEGISRQSEELIEFKSTTAGDYDGFIIEFEGNENTKIEFKSDVMTLIFSPSQIQDREVFEVGEVEIQFEILPVYEEEYPSEVEIEFEDTSSGPSAYYLKVLQTDGEKAWTSPIFVNWEA